MNLHILLRHFATMALLAIGEAIIIISGGLDLSIGSMVALNGMILAALITNIGINWFIASLITIIFSILVGLWHSFFVNKFSPPLPSGIPSFLITLITLTTARGIAQYSTSGFPIGIDVAQNELLIFLGQGAILNIPIVFILLIIVSFLAYYLLNLTPVGKHIYAIGGNLEAAIACGINYKFIRYISFMIAGFLTGLTSIIITARLTSAWPGTGSGYELEAIAACALGGISLSGGEGSLLGAIIGSLIMATIRIGLVTLEVSPYLHEIITGIILFIAVAINFLRQRKLEES
ncbi:MAG: ABC transporter permease [Candidatus Methanomethylicaceae archaeon]